jgi:hypothetical protein
MQDKLKRREKEVAKTRKQYSLCRRNYFRKIIKPKVLPRKLEFKKP